MQKKQVSRTAVTTVVLVVLLGAVWRATAQDAKTPYPNMAPVEPGQTERLISRRVIARMNWE